MDTRRRADGELSYRVRWRLGGTRDGAFQTETFTSEARARSFKEDVEAAGNFWPRGWRKGEGYVEQAATGNSFEAVVDHFLMEQERRIARGRVKAYTVHRYRGTILRHFMPAFGTMPLSDIAAEDVTDWVDAEIDAGWSPKSIKNWHGVLYSVMQHGQKRMGLRPDNPCDLTELPEANSRDARQVRFFQEGEWALMRGCLKEDVHLLTDVMLATGVRWGEVSAFRVGDATVRGEDTVSLHVVRAWSTRAPDDKAPIKYEEGENSKHKLGPPKSKRSRYVVITGDLAQRFLAHIEGLPTKAYVFTTARGNPWRYTEFHSDRWLPARREAKKRGLEKHPTPHMLRHTTVVWSLARGVRIEVISEMLGHASIQITYDVYGGLIDLHDPVLAQAMAAAMTSVRQAIVPVPTREEVDNRVIRPGRRGELRSRAS